MTEQRHPWWASDLDAAATAPVDPLEAHRAARRGTVPPVDPAGWFDPDQLLADDATDDDATNGDATGHRPDVCGVCPICIALRALAETRPQLVEHLTEAARHLAAAVRSAVDEPTRSRPDDAHRDRGGSTRGTDPFERIDLD